jgi:hypothetical protein
MFPFPSVQFRHHQREEFRRPHPFVLQPFFAVVVLRRMSLLLVDVVEEAKVEPAGLVVGGLPIPW